MLGMTQVGVNAKPSNSIEWVEKRGDTATWQSKGYTFTVETVLTYACTDLVGWQVTGTVTGPDGFTFSYEGDTFNYDGTTEFQNDFPAQWDLAVDSLEQATK